MSLSGRDVLGRRRVVVSGMGAVTTIGETPAEYCASLQAGRSGITRWKAMDPRLECKIGGDLGDFDLAAHLARAGGGYPAELRQRALRLLRATPLPGRLASAAALQAAVDAGLPGAALDPERVGHVLAGYNLNARYIYDNALTFQEEPEFIDPLYGIMFLDTDVLSAGSELLGLRGPCFTVGSACGSGNLALMMGLDLLRAGRADAVLVTGVAPEFEPVQLQGWTMVDAIAVRSFNDEPWRASRPFDVRREGFVPSEGAGAVVLETLDSARARGARIHAELLGAASAGDATRLPKPNAEGQARAMRLALADARVPAEQVDYVNAHATSTVAGDVVEAEAIRAVLGERAGRVPVNATKSMIGHCLTAAGLLEFVAVLLQMEHRFLHPTINLDEPEPGLGLDVVAREARPYRIEMALSNSFGFGGLNLSVVVGRVP